MSVYDDAIHPTHRAFDDALEFIEELARHKNPLLFSGRLRVVHAVVAAPNGREAAQAWIEQDNQYVIFAGILDGVRSYFAADRQEYYDDIKVKETTKYTVQQALELNLIHKTFGPWERRYQVLCGRTPGDEWSAADV